MNTCKYLKQKLNRTLYCKNLNKFINLDECKTCNTKVFQQIKSSNPLKKATYRRTKRQKERFSIIYRCLTKCANCGLKIGVQKNEVFEGAKRGVSMDNGFVIPLCDTCHKRFHNDREFALKYKRMFQAKYEETHTRNDFLNLIHHNYL